jgi:hypothetical protein
MTFFTKRPLTPTEQELLDNVLDRFDVKKVERIMEVLDWKWFGSEEKNPQSHEILATGRRLLQDALRYTNASHGTGGLVARCDDGYLSLTFEAVNSEFDVEWLTEGQEL